MNFKNLILLLGLIICCSIVAWFAWDLYSSLPGCIPVQTGYGVRCSYQGAFG
jgi:hypothetical protein